MSVETSLYRNFVLDKTVVFHGVSGVTDLYPIYDIRDIDRKWWSPRCRQSTSLHFTLLVFKGDDFCLSLSLLSISTTDRGVITVDPIGPLYQVSLIRY